ncbi:MAG TPA: ankyrin repeat domain-containing protein [Puia sp.]|nr:ankyrin repeat domain-containing protein [Puia sp.]
MKVDYSVFRPAIEAMNTGNAGVLKQLLADNHGFTAFRLDEPTHGHFAHPYLLWFIADNPVRNGWFPANICEITSLIIDAIRRDAPETLQYQVNYALEFLTTGRTPTEPGLSTALIDVLIDSGAVPTNGISALAHRNPDAARHLIARGGGMTLAAAIGLDDWENARHLFPHADSRQRELALALAVHYNHNAAIAWLLKLGVNPNSFPEDDTGYFSNETPLHRATNSGNVEAVKLLLAAGADIGIKDRLHNETPPRWAQHFVNEDKRSDEYLERVCEIIELFRLHS